MLLRGHLSRIAIGRSTYKSESMPDLMICNVRRNRKQRSYFGFNAASMTTDSSTVMRASRIQNIAQSRKTDIQCQNTTGFETPNGLVLINAFGSKTNQIFAFKKPPKL